MIVASDNDPDAPTGFAKKSAAASDNPVRPMNEPIRLPAGMAFPASANAAKSVVLVLIAVSFTVDTENTKSEPKQPPPPEQYSVSVKNALSVPAPLVEA